MDIFGVGSLDRKYQTELIRKHLLNLTTSYSDESDVFTELIQNAIDAINLRSASQATDRGELTLLIGRRKGHDHYIYVQDNGVGMAPDLVDKVFIPGFSAGKSQGRSIGYKGVGMSYVVAVSNNMSIRSIQNKIASERTIKYTHDWVVDSEKSEPIVADTFQAPQRVRDLASEIECGTGVYFAFHAGSTPRSLDHTVVVTQGIQKELTYWAGYLCAKTALGLAEPASEHETSIRVRMILDLGEEGTHEASFDREGFSISKGKLGYPFPESVFRVGVDTDTIDATPEGQRHVQHGRRQQAVYHRWAAPDLINDMENLDIEERAGLSTHLRWVTGYLSYSTGVMQEIRKQLGTRAQVVRYGARLVVDGAPQGRPLELALTSDQGLDRQTHIVLGFSDLELDTGRKFVSDERTLSAINKVTQRVVTRLKDYRWALKVKDAEPIDANLADWVNTIMSRAGNSQIPELFTHLKSIPPARVDPGSEQEVIALWTALLTTGSLPGYAMKAISGFNRYDALIDITTEAANAVGMLGSLRTDYRSKSNAVLEFKLSFDDLITDFENNKKIPREMDLVVCWDCPDINMRIGRLRPTYGDWSHERPLRAVSYIWYDDANSVKLPVIALKNVVAEILNENGSKTGAAILAILQNRDSDKLK
ncbi:hypothetical protein StoSoilA2_11610 [Arthrobacter sp. StoSoilA2]|uniref:ATP-binding protein n=1 Tax=Arthrobacter sp. StoSoilA2 TaxID=2830990 RepID=UPI001CC584FE|nr:ATP-binding protein [Arthrobacter sp. StoSoilA2]BCW35105.1 hypothetical protein StoSoilA2_11610 [Arthrobacter sp. StoSoilA2]